jgi:hypothetical protein
MSENLINLFKNKFLPKMKRIIYIILLINTQILFSQSRVNCLWADNDPNEGLANVYPSKPTMAISGIEFTKGVATDVAGNVYVAGQYQKKFSAGTNKNAPQAKNNKPIIIPERYPYFFMINPAGIAIKK